jgi:4,5-dihydroxyphthalate decarboxylase
MARAPRRRAATMTDRLKLTVACGDYEIVRALKEGAVRADGMELTFLTGMGSRERHWRMLRRLEFDVCELNVGAHFMAVDQGMPFAGLPIYLHRRFRHGFLFVNAKAGIAEPRQLAGRTVGGTNFQPAANVWMRGILEEYYGLPHRSVTWLVDRSEDIEFERPKDLRLEMVPPGKPLETMLAEGEIPALLSPSVPLLFAKGDKRIVRLFPNYQEIEVEFFRCTGIFPIMHTTVIKRDIVERHPWVATNLLKAFEQAKAIAYRRTANPRVVPLAWVRTAWEEQEEILGPDPWAYGLGDANRKNLETVLRYTHEQGMIRRRPALDELFADCDLGDAGGEESGL